jgi:hypothetical protein
VDRLPALAAELVALKVEVILAAATPAAMAARNATDRIAISEGRADCGALELGHPAGGSGVERAENCRT